jgi:serine/threonine-protein kinase
VRNGSTVTLIVANGPYPATVPDVLNYTEAAARDRIAAAGLTAKVVTEREPPPGGDQPQRRGLVWKQSPTAGSGVERASTVTVWINPG